MTKIHSFSHVYLTVSDCQRSKKFYEELLDVKLEEENGCVFNLKNAGLHCWFVQHDKTNKDDKFDETRVGLDHIAFELKKLSELEKIIQRLDSLGVKNKGIEMWAGKYPYVAFRDPDNIQVEFFIHDIK